MVTCVAESARSFGVNSAKHKCARKAVRKQLVRQTPMCIYVFLAFGVVQISRNYAFPPFFTARLSEGIFDVRRRSVP